MQTNKVALFEGKTIRRVWDEKAEKWHFSVVDVIQVLTGQIDYQKARKYWNKLRERLGKEGSESVTNCHRLKLMASDGKYYATDTADVETLFRLIQSIPSPKAEPFKLWLARVGYERIEEINDPEKSINRARENWKRFGRSEKWIQQRMMGQETRNKLTDYWKGHGVEKQNEYAILTNVIHKEWSDLTVKEHKNLKKLETENLRDHMTEAELIFTALAEFSARQISASEDSRGLDENKATGKEGGHVAKKARIDLEQRTGTKIVSGDNYKIKEKKSKFLNK